MNQEIKRALLIPCGRSEKLCLVTMCTYVHKIHWQAAELNHMLGIHKKTIHTAMRQLIILGVVESAGKDELNSNVYTLNLARLKQLANDYAFNLLPELRVNQAISSIAP
jgi:hypothetical protein